MTLLSGTCSARGPVGRRGFTCAARGSRHGRRASGRGQERRGQEHRLPHGRCWAPGSPAAWRSAPERSTRRWQRVAIRSGRGTTLAKTLLRGTPGAGGYRKIVVGPGEPHLVRHELPAARGQAPRRPAAAPAGRARPAHRHARAGRAVPGPRRVPRPATTTRTRRSRRTCRSRAPTAPRRCSRRTSPRRWSGPCAGPARPGDRAAALVRDHHRRQRRQHPATTSSAGRSTCSTASPIRPDSGDLTKYEGVADQVAYHERYWHPDGPPPGQVPDLPTSLHGFPGVPGLLDACRAPFRAKGVGMPWLSVFGNHDGLVQGNVPTNPLVAQLATGPAKIIDLPPGTDIVTARPAAARRRPAGAPDAVQRAVPAGDARRGPAAADADRDDRGALPHRRQTARARLLGVEPRHRQRLLHRRSRAGPRHRARHRQPVRRLRGLDRRRPSSPGSPHS